MEKKQDAVHDGSPLDMFIKEHDERPPEQEEVEQDQATETPESGTPAKPTEAEKPAPDAAPEPEATDWKAETEKLKKEREVQEKRIKDNQAAFHEGQQKLAELQKQLEELKTRKADADTAETPDDENWLSPKERKLLEEQSKRLEKVETYLTEMRRDKALDVWNAKEEKAKTDHEDYDDVVYKVFEPAFKEDQKIQEQFREQGADPAAAYKIGRKLKDLKEMTEDPDGYRKRLETEIRQKLENGELEDDNNGEPVDIPAAKTRPKTLATMNSRSPAGKDKPLKVTSSILDQTLDEIHGRTG